MHINQGVNPKSRIDQDSRSDRWVAFVWSSDGDDRSPRSSVIRGKSRLDVRQAKKGPSDVKTMTCKQLGGPCDYALRGETADDVIHAQDKHLKDAVAEGDDSHRDALQAMKGRWKRPWSGMKWYKSTKREFAALPEE